MPPETGSPDRIRTGVSGLKGRARTKRSLTTINANSREIAVDQVICKEMSYRYFAAACVDFHSRAAQERPKPSSEGGPSREPARDQVARRLSAGSVWAARYAGQNPAAIPTPRPMRTPRSASLGLMTGRQLL
jgi:hypothetical protein